MPTTVPNWITDAVAVEMNFGNPGNHAYRVKGWRATKTRVMVTLEGHWSKNEIAFRLDDLGEIGKPKYEALYLFPPDHEHVIEVTRKQTVARVGLTVLSAARGLQLDPYAMTAEQMGDAIDDLMKVCSGAIIDLARVA